MKIGGIDIKRDVFSIAEIGANHNGSIERAERQIELARNSGASAVKFQAWSVDSLVSRHYLSGQPNGMAILEEIGTHAVDTEQIRRLKGCSDSLGILFSCSVFSKAEIDLMADLDVSFLKIASSIPEKSVTMPPASRTSNTPAATSHGLRLYS